MVKGDKAYLVKAHKGREKTTPLAARKGQTSKQQIAFCSKRIVNMTKQMEAMYLHLLHGPAFGYQKPPNGRYDPNGIIIFIFPLL